MALWYDFVLSVQDKDIGARDPAGLGSGNGDIQSFGCSEDELGLSYPEMMSEFMCCVTGVCASEASPSSNDPEIETGVVNLVEGVSECSKGTEWIKLNVHR
jgi:hypothetical protein